MPDNLDEPHHVEGVSIGRDDDLQTLFDPALPNRTLSKISDHQPAIRPAKVEENLRLFYLVDIAEAKVE